MAQTVPARATYEDVLALPEHLVGQILDGQLYTHPRPAPAHARALTVLTAALGSRYDRSRSGPGGWLLLMEPEIHLGGSIVVPDLAGWRRETATPLQVDKAYFEQAPDFVCEGLSPSTARVDRGPKRRLYARAGVAHLWFVDPAARSLEVLVLTGDGYRIHDVYGEDESPSPPPFDDAPLALESLWTW